VADYLGSELTIEEWCKRNGFKDGQLRYWLRKARQEGFIDRVSQGWACVEVVDNDSMDASAPVIAADRQQLTDESGLMVRVGSATIEVRPGFNPSLLSEVLRVVAATC